MLKIKHFKLKKKEGNYLKVPRQHNTEKDKKRDSLPSPLPAPDLPRPPCGSALGDTWNTGKESWLRSGM